MAPIEPRAEEKPPLMAIVVGRRCEVLLTRCDCNDVCGATGHFQKFYAARHPPNPRTPFTRLCPSLHFILEERRPYKVTAL